MSSGSHARTTGSASLGPQRGVALLQRPLVATPVLHEPWFHVEHTPIEVTAALLRPLLDQSMHLRVDRLHRQDRRELGEAADPLSRRARLETLTAVTDPDWPQTLAGLEATGQQQLLLALANQGLVARRAERAATAQEENRLEQAGLAGGVGSADQVAATVEFQVGGFDAAEIADFAGGAGSCGHASPMFHVEPAAGWHSQNPGLERAQSRIGMTT